MVPASCAIRCSNASLHSLLMQDLQTDTTSQAALHTNTMLAMFEVNNNCNSVTPYVFAHCIIHAGIYTNSYDATLNAKNGFPVFSTIVEANWLSKSEDKYAAFRLTDEDKDEINKLSKQPDIGETYTVPVHNVPYGSVILNLLHVHF